MLNIKDTVSASLYFDSVHTCDKVREMYSKITKLDDTFLHKGATNLEQLLYLCNKLGKCRVLRNVSIWDLSADGVDYILLFNERGWVDVEVDYTCNSQNISKVIEDAYNRLS